MNVVQAFKTPKSRDIAAHRDVAAAGVFHDLGNLIQIATSAINIIARTPEMPAMHAGPMLDRARIGLEHAGALVRQNIVRIRDHRLDGEHCDVVACLTDVVTLVEAMDEPGLVLVLDVEPDLPDVRCDDVGLRRAVLNLVFNARDAIAGNGVVVIEARSIFSGVIATTVEIRIVDNGVGMAHATIERAFDPFFTTKRDGLGGIGLPMVAGFVARANGEIAIDSETGVGTTMTLRLPTVAGLPSRTDSIPEESKR